MFRKLLIGLSLFTTSLFAAPAGSGIVMTPDNTIVLRGVIEPQMASKFVKEFQELATRDDVKVIYVYIISPGGSIFAGNAITNIIDSTDKEVVVVVDFAASMAFHVTSHGHKKLITSTGVLMQHHASGGVEGQFPNMDSEWTWVKKLVHEMNEFDAASCKNVTYNQFMKNIDRDWWLTPLEAKEAGCISEIAKKVSCSKELSNKIVLQVVNFYGIEINVKWSGCPLEAYPRDITIKGEITRKEKQLFDQYMLLNTDPMMYYKLYGTFNFEKFLK